MDVIRRQRLWLEIINCNPCIVIIGLPPVTAGF